MNSSLKTQESAGDICFSATKKSGKAHFKEGQFIKQYINSESPSHYYLALADLQKKKEAQLAGETKKPVVLIIYNNNEISDFLPSALSYNYIIHQVYSDKLGFEFAKNQLPDLIITNVMMPKMDGLKLCKLLKTDQQTGHIPVILLADENENFNQLSVLEAGADAYVIRPFSFKLLELNIRNLMASRNAMRHKYAQEITLQPSNTFINSMDEKFLNKMIKIVESNMDNTNFEVRDMIEKIGMSKRVLYKKLQALTNMTVGNFVKSVRLQKAANLLLREDLNIADIAYSVGFTDRKYFSKQFKKVFGKSPSKYKK